MMSAMPDLISGLIIGMSVALAISSSCCIGFAVLAAYLKHQLKNKNKKISEDKKRKSCHPDYYVDDYYVSIK